jgi:excisionase family DNA binding protein
MPEVELEPAPPARSEMLSYREAARLLGLPVGTLYTLVHTRRVPHVRLGGRLVRFSRLELERWVNERIVPERAKERRDA